MLSTRGIIIFIVSIIILVSLLSGVLADTPYPTPTDDDVSSFEAWLHARADSIPHTAQQEEGKTRGRKITFQRVHASDVGYIGNVKVLAGEDIKRNEVVYQYPFSQSLDVPSSDTRSKKTVDDAFSVPPDALIHLLDKRERGDSDWAPYLKILPSSLSTPLFWSREELNELSGTSLYGSLSRLNRTIAFEHKQAIKTLPTPSPTPSSTSHTRSTDPASSSLYPLSAYTWAYSVYRARTWKTETENKFMPVLELFNYGSKANVNISANGGSLVFTANEDITKGDKIIINDGLAANGVLLEWYGFVIADNPLDSYPVGVGLDEDDKLYRWKLDQFKQRGIEDGQTFMLERNHIPLDLVFALRIHHATLYDHAEAGEAFRGRIISVQNEMRVCETIIDLCKSTLKNMRSSTKEDNNRMLDTNLSTNLRNAIVIRRAERNILRSVLKMAKTQLEDVHSAWNLRSYDVPSVQDKEEL